MKAEIISIGSEITSGKNLDTNSQWLSRRLGEIGIPVAFHTTIADDLDDNIAAFRLASERADLVISTGGLGPTLDDLTREVIATVAGVTLVEDADALARIQAMFGKRGRVMPERNRVQALTPSGATVVPNDYGTAPGIRMQVNRATIIALPGVPTEMKGMFADVVRPWIVANGFGGGVLLEHKINCFGTGESAIEELLKDVTRRGNVPEVGITASDATISLRILANAPTMAEALAMCNPVEAVIRERLGRLVFGSDEEELQDIVVTLLKQRGATVATAESITAGLVAHRLALVPGASAVLKGGFVTYTDAMKQSLLGIPSGTLATFGAVSSETATAMATAARERTGADYGVATTGFAGPATENDAHPVGTVFVAVAGPDGVTTQGYSWMGTRQEIQSRTAKQALNWLRLRLG